jgi:hypothetical protein
MMAAASGGFVAPTLGATRLPGQVQKNIKIRMSGAYQ